ncbi:hypothetical protein DRF65_25780 [Chryseobacterium pennae]|uniref:N-acetyltransferase domain-containing protein n=1 Tax=Chryseobacterium pennae TaxID=2258962 RepID=A0A3D9C0W3_9FLAO|nr:GNAT family N-acetyltransferase [Chryseobacterium pennae]REC59495.1 hypothetical protein DRF65_25780 [Chryseobacterium pennae]
MIINIEPNIQQLNEVKGWLKREFDISKEGFYCNWNTIEKSYQRQQLITCTTDDGIVGFISWAASNDNGYVEIDIFEIHPNFRKMWYGKKLYELAELYFKSKGFKAVILYCEPRESEAFWKKMNFIKFPSRGYSESDLYHYKPLIDVNKNVELVHENKLELWEMQSCEINNNKPKWSWIISRHTPPVLQPCHGDWYLRLTKDGVVVKENSVKNFDNNEEVLLDPFLYIDTSKYFIESNAEKKNRK